MQHIFRKIIFLVLALLFAFGWLYFGSALFSNSGSVERFLAPQPTLEESLGDFDFTLPTPQPLAERTANTKFKQTAWIPDWDMTNGLKSLSQVITKMDSVSPVWYYLESDTKVKVNLTKLEELKALTKANHVKLLPTISSFDPDDMHAIMQSPQTVKAHADFLISEVKVNGFDGIDLDYESIYLNDQIGFFDLIKQLSDALKPQGKTLSVTVLLQLNSPKTIKQTVHVQDWTEIAQYADELRIMAYNFTGYSSVYPGPISPLDWQEAALRYARRNLDMSKVILGLSLYGYDGWSEHPEITVPYIPAESNPTSEKGQADAVTYEQVQATRKYMLSDILDPDFMEKVMRYRYNNKDYVIIYQDAVSTALRKKLAQDYGAAGVAYWRMGGEDISLY